ncbi:DUF2339 domain-containing protein [Novosphingobium rosa]|uniref:DUF2339 domain-containing protein n=1 Tax=Novosphingobium rosa TaxID=76978 RepID=UPI000832836C|nr:DUF2339 domain-containing protein [Novosphingobium rosa]
MTFLLLIGVIVLGGLLHDTRKRLAAVEKALKAEGALTPAAPKLVATPKTVAKPTITPWLAKPDPLPEKAVEEPHLAPVVEEPVATPLEHPAEIVEAPEATTPPPAEPVPLPQQAVPAAAKPRRQSAGFEDLFGRKLPIWAGGITLLIAAALLVRYSIDAGLLSPVVRVVMGAIFGFTLIAGAEITHRKPALAADPRIPQALSGAGIGSLYAATLAAANLYGLIGPIAAFAALACVTGGAMALALRFGAPSALLGLVGGLAAPALVQSHSYNPPMLAAYIALVVTALTMLSRRQRWVWLGVSALVGGAGWSLLMIAMGGLDTLSALCIGALILLLGLGLPVLATTERHTTLLRGASATVAALQLAALVATGDFAPLTWGLYGLLSAGFVWLTTRVPALRPLLILPLLTALSLLAIWPDPHKDIFIVVLAGITLIHGGPALHHLRRAAGLPEAASLAAIALAGFVITCWHFDPSTGHTALLALCFAVLPALGATLTWASARAPEGDPFAMQAGASAVLIAFAAMIALPAWAAPAPLAVVAFATLALASRARNRRLSHIALLGLGSSLIALSITGSPGAEFRRLVQDSGFALPGASLIRWGLVAASAVGFARLLMAPRERMALQGLAALLTYGALAQLLPAPWLAPACALALLGLSEIMRRRSAFDLLPALLMTSAIGGLWALQPLGLWLTAGLLSVAAQPVLASTLPTPLEALRQLLLPALLAGFALWRQRGQRLPANLWLPLAGTLGALAVVALHVLFKQIFALKDVQGFIALGMAERTLWQALLIGGGIALWRFVRRPVAALALIGAGLAHALLYTVALHNPLWAEQAVGPLPVANLLLPAYGLIFLALALPGRIMPAWERLTARPVEWARIALIPLLAASLLRQLFAGSMPAAQPIGAGESILWSLTALSLAVAYLVWGIRRRADSASRDWRIASLVLMLAAVGKVFLLDASGLEGLARIGSFLALGFSLIGVGWLYSRYLKPTA